MKTTMRLKSMALIALLGAALAAPVLAQGGPGMAFNQGNTRGWELMTPEERGNFQKQMRSVKTYDECVAVQAEHRGAMEVRAKEKGVTLQNPRQNACENLKARGVIQ